MKINRFSSTMFIASVLLLWTGLILARAEGHPRLFITEERLEALRQLVRQSENHHGMAYAMMKARVDAPNLDLAYTDHIAAYKRSYKAREAALLALLAGHSADQQHYAQLALQMIQEMYSDPATAEWTPVRGSGLARSIMGLGMALAYDWCHAFWDPEQRQFVRAKIIEALEAWEDFKHANLQNPGTSNWVAVVRGGELILMLAAAEEANRPERYKFLKAQLLRHMRTAFGNLGVSQEGVGYTEYPGGFLLPAILAAKHLGDSELWNQAQRHQWWRLAMHTHSFMGPERKFVMTGVSHSSNYNEGWPSLLLSFVPEEHAPHYLWWYDRHIGRLSKMGKSQFDGDRAGTVWAILCHPGNLQSQDPTGVRPSGAADQRGYFFFRNRWRDENDIQVGLSAKTTHHPRAWAQPETFALNLMAFNTRFIGGPGKERSQSFYSSLLVDGQYNTPKTSAATGRVEFFEAGPERGYAIADGGPFYQQLGASKARRHLLADFSPAGGQAVLSTLDLVESGQERTWIWQAKTGHDRGDDGVRVLTGTEDARPSFTMRGRNDGYVKGWVLHPAAAQVKLLGETLQIETAGQEAAIWIVLLAGQGEAPSAQITGNEMQSELRIAGRTVRFDPSSQRITSD